MNENNLIYDWNVINWELNRDESKHPHKVWFDDETLRDGLQSPSARNPTIEQKIELLTTMFENNYNQRVDYDVNFYSESIIRHDFYIEDQFGEVVNLDEFSGKVLYVDIWASWCGPCRKQFPYSKELKRKFSKRQQKKIKFIYISIDNDHNKWKESLQKLDLEGEHFISPANHPKSAANYFQAFSIPRYILIDKNGNILNMNAKRPSDIAIYDELLQLLD